MIIVYSVQASLCAYYATFKPVAIAVVELR